MPRPLNDQFHKFADLYCKDSSDLYFHLCHAIAEDESILRIAAQTKNQQPIPNLLLASVHYLLIKNPLHPLSEYYESLAEQTKAPEKAYSLFREFTLSNEADIIHILKTRLVQTNEVRRCSFLLPSFLYAVKKFPIHPLALIELGCSAGFNLAWDHYYYHYGTTCTYGNVRSAVKINAEFSGNIPTAIAGKPPQINQRIGLDLNPVDASVPDNVDWLLALLWPGQKSRRELLAAAANNISHVNLDLRQGNALTDLPAILDSIPEDTLPCIFHTFMANQLTEDQRKSLIQVIDDLGSKRDLIHISNYLHGLNLDSDLYYSGRKSFINLAEVDYHGRWIKWLAH